MDSSIKFFPLWEEATMMAAPLKELHDLRAKMVAKLMDERPEGTQRAPSTEDVINSCVYLLQMFLWDTSEENVVLKKIRALAESVEEDPAQFAQHIIHLWYEYATHMFVRDPPALEDVYSDGWNEGSGEHTWISYYGHLSMLLLADVWEEPAHPKLQRASLVANATITLLFTVYNITSKLQRKDLIFLDLHPGHRPMQVFLRTTWQVAREGWKRSTLSPGSEFGTHLHEIRLTPCGKDLQTKVGLKRWDIAPYWHPARKVPGSSWNKFFTNRKQPIFPGGYSHSPGIHFKVPSSALALLDTWETYYATLAEKMDANGMPRKRPQFSRSCRQFSKLAMSTGNPYPFMRPDEQSAVGVWQVPQEYTDTSPMIKKPSLDLAGNMTPAFLTTVIRAIRYQEEPEESDENFFVMTFQL